MAAAETNEGFQFYLRFAKPLVLSLPSAKDRVLAAAWVQKLKDEKSGSEKARTDHLKLLLFVLQKGRLFGPFINNPGQHDALDEFPMAIKLRDIAKQWVESEDTRKKARLMEGLGAGDFPPLTTECSADLLEYVAAQDIPNFGVHAYYAISNEPINAWENVEKGIFPKGALNVIRKAESADISAASSKRSRQRSRSRSRTLGDSDVSGRDRSNMAQVSFMDEIGDRPYAGKPEKEKPLSPLGSPLPPARTSPTWGSNLISVGDPPSPEGMKFAPPKESVSGTDKAASKSLSMKDLSAFSQTPVRRKLDFSYADTTPISPITLPPIPEKFSYPEPSPKTSTPIVGLYLPPMGEGEVSDLFGEEPPSFLAGDELMVTPPPATRARLEEAPSLPYQTPTWDITAPSLPYQTPPWDMSAPSLPYQTPVRRRLDFSDADTTPISPIILPPIPERLSYPEPSPRRTTPIISRRQPSPPLPQEEATFLFEEEAPSFFDDEDIMATPTSGISPFEEAPSLPYQTPPWDMSAPSIPYQTPPWDMSAPSIPYQTPEWDRSAPSLPYRSPDWDMSAPSVPYRTPDWDMSAASLPYRTPPYDPAAMARSQYVSLFDSPGVAMSSPVPQRRTPLLSEDDMDDFSLMEDMFDAEDTLGSTEDFSAIEKWAEASSETPPAVFPRKKRTPKAEVEEVLAKGISVSPGAEDIVDEAIQEMSIVGEEQGDLEQLYEEENAAFPHRHRGMKTPPVFSRSSRIREAGRHIRYREEQFGVREPIEWRPAEEALSSTAMPTSPPENLRDRFRQRPFKDIFPGIEMPADYAPLDEDEEIDLIEDEKLVRSPKKRDLQKRLHDVIDEIDRMGDEVAVAGGVGLTTPKRSPSPVRPDRGDDDLFFFTEKPPEGFGMSPEDYLSPESRAALQWAQLQKSPTSPIRERTPSPPRIETPEFLREQRRRASPTPTKQYIPPAPPESETEPEPEPFVPERKKKRGKKKTRATISEVGVSTPTDEDYEEEEIIDEQTQELYKSLIQSEEEPFPPPPRTPPPRTPPPRTPSPRSPGMEYPEIPPTFNIDMFGTPPRRRMTKEEFPEGLEFEEEPYFEEPWLQSPPTPPSPFEYESPHYSPLDESPPIKELLEAHEFTENFFDPDRPQMRKSVLLPGGRRVPVRRHSRAPPLSPIRDEHLEGLFPSPPPGDAFERALEMARQFAPPTPTPPRAPPSVPPSEQPQPEVCKKAPVKGAKKVKGKAKPSTSKTRVRPSTSKTKGKQPQPSKTLKTRIKAPAEASTRPPSPVPGPSREKTPPAAATERPMFDREVHRPLTRKEHYYLKSFADSKHEDLLARVTRLIADVGFPLESPPPERDEFEHIEGAADMDISPPEFDYPPDEDLPELSPERPPSPIPQFDFQSDVRDFMSPPKPTRLPIVPLSPSQLPGPPPFVPPFIPFPYDSPDSPGENLLDTSPPFVESPPATPRTPESPDIDYLTFISEINAAQSPTFYDYMNVRQGTGQFRLMRRHSAAPGLRRVPEAPETAEFEEHMPFHERVSSAVRPGRRRTIRAGPRKVRPSAAPGLPTVSEQIDYPESPMTTRSPATPPRIVSPPRRRPIVEEGERLIDVSPEPLTPEGPPKATRIKRRVTRRRIDFDAPPPTPERPPPDKVKGERRPGRRIDFGEPPRRTDYFPQFQIELTEEELGPPPEELMGERYPMEYDSPKESVIDYPIPDLPSPTVSPRRGDTPFLFPRPPQPKKEFEFKLLPRLKNVLDFQSPIEFPPSPEPLPEEMEESPLATWMPGFAPSPPPTPISPYELPPSIEKKFGRQVTPEARRRHPMAARLVTPPREDRQLDAALLAAHRQYQALLMDTPPAATMQTAHPGAIGPSPPRRVPTPPRRTSPVAGPSRSVVTTSETVISPRERRTTSTKTETTGSPFTPPMMILPPPHVDPFLEPADIDIFSEEMPELMEPSPEEVTRRGVMKAPLRSTRRPVQLYGYGERKPMQLQRKQRPPGLGTVAEVTDEPADQYEYWPGPHIPQVSKPTPMYTGGKLGPTIYRNVPPVSGKGVAAEEWDTTRAYVPSRRIPPERPRMLSPPQTRRKRRERMPRAALTARKRLEFDEPPSPKTYEEYLEQLVADVPLPEGDLDVPQLPPAAHIEFEPPAWSPVPIAALERHETMELESEEPLDWEQYESPRTPRKSPELPFVDMDDMLGDVSPPIDLAADLSFSPVSDVSPPPGMEELDELEAPPPCGTCGQGSPEELQQRIREHEYTIHKGDTRKRHLASKRIHVKGRPYKVRKSQAPSLIPLQEQEEPPESPRRRPPPYVSVGTLLDITPPPRDEIQDVIDITQRQYAMLMDSPERRSPDVMETTAMEEYILDQPIGAQARRALPLPITQQVDFGSPPLPPPKIPGRYKPPPATSPELFTAMAPLHDDYMLDYMESPPFITTPPRDIFAEGVEMEEEEEEDLEALLTGSPVRRTPPDNNCIPLNTDNEMEAPTKQKPIIQHNATVFSHFYTKYPYNELSYCLEKGLDYFPVKESDTSYAILPLGFETKECTPPVNNTNGKDSNLFAETKFSSYTDAIIAPNFTFLSNNLLLSEFIVAFHYFLHHEESVEETLPHYRSQTTTESVHSTLSPQQQFRLVAPNRAAGIATQQFTSFNNQRRPFRPLSPEGRMSPQPMCLDNSQQPLQESPDRNAMETIYRAPINANSSGSLSHLERGPRALESPLNRSARLRDGLNMPRRRGLPLQLSGTTPSPIPHVSPPGRLRYMPRQRTLPLKLSRTPPSPIPHVASPVRLQGSLNMPRQRASPLQLSETLPSSIPHVTPPIRLQGSLKMPRQRALPLQLSETLPSPIPYVISPVRLQGSLNMSRQRAPPLQLSETLPSSIQYVTPPNRLQGNLNMPRQRASPLQEFETLPGSIPHETPPMRLQGSLNMPRQRVLPLQLSGTLPSPIPHTAPSQRYPNVVYNTLPAYQSNLSRTASPYASRTPSFGGAYAESKNVPQVNAAAPYAVRNTESGVGPYSSRLATINSMSVPPSAFNTSVVNNQLPQNKKCVETAIPLCACVTEYINKIIRNLIAPPTLAEPKRVQYPQRLQERVIANDEAQTNLNISPFLDMPRPTSQRAFGASVPPGFPSALPERSQVNFRRDRTLTPIRRIRKRLFATSSPANGTAAQYLSRVEEGNLEASYDSNISRNLPLRRPEAQSTPQPPRTFADLQVLRRDTTSTPVRTDKRYFQALSPHNSHEVNVVQMQSLQFTSEVEDASTSYLDYAPYQSSRRDGTPRQVFVRENNVDDTPRSLPLTFPKSPKLKSAAQQPHTFADFDYLRKYKASTPAKRINRRLFETLSSDNEANFEPPPIQSRVEEDERSGDDLPHSFPKQEVPKLKSAAQQPHTFADFDYLRKHKASTPAKRINRRLFETLSSDNEVDFVPPPIQPRVEEDESSCDDFPHSSPKQEVRSAPPRLPESRRKPYPSELNDSLVDIDELPHQEFDKEKSTPNAQISGYESDVEDESKSYLQALQEDDSAPENNTPSIPSASADRPEESNALDYEAVAIESPIAKTDATNYITESTPKTTSIPVSVRSRNISKPLSPTQVRDADKSPSSSVTDAEPRTTSELCPGCGLDPDRDFSLTTNAFPEDISEPKVNVDRKEPLSSTPERRSSPVSDSYPERDSDPEYNIVRKQLFSPTSKPDSTSGSKIDSEPEYNTVRKRPFSPTSEQDSPLQSTVKRPLRSTDNSCPECDSEPEYNTRPFSSTPGRRSPSFNDEYPEGDSEPKYNIVRKQLFTPASKRGTSSRSSYKRDSRLADDSCPGCDSEPEYSTTRKRPFSYVPGRRSPSTYDEYPEGDSEPEYNIVRKQLFTPTSKRGTSSRSSYKRDSRLADDSCPGCESEPEYNTVRKRPFSSTPGCRLPSTYDEYPEDDSEPEYNIVRKQLFSPTSKRDTSSRSAYKRDSRLADDTFPGYDFEPKFNAVRKRHVSPTPKHDSSPACDECPKCDPKPDHNIVRKQLFSSTPKEGPPSISTSKHDSRSADDSCPGCDSEAEGSMVPKRRFTSTPKRDSTPANAHDSASNLSPGYNSEPDYNVGGRQIFISTIKSTPRRFSTDRTRAPSNCECSDNKIIDDQLTADISRHLNKLPTTDTSNNQHDFFPAPTHLIISTFGPVHLSTIPNVPFNQTCAGAVSNEVSALIQQTDSDKMKKLDEETGTADDKASQEVVITPVLLPQAHSEPQSQTSPSFTSDTTAPAVKKVSISGSPSKSKKSPSVTPTSSHVTPTTETSLLLETSESQSKKSPTVTPKSSKRSRLPTPKGSKTASIQNETPPKTSCAALCTKTSRPSNKKSDGKLNDETTEKTGSNVCPETCTEKFERSRCKLDDTYTVVTSKQSGICPQFCAVASTCSKRSLPEKAANVLENVRDENVLRNIVLDTEMFSKSRTPSIKLKDSKIKADRGTCTSEICAHIPADRKLCTNPTCSTTLYEKQCPSSVCESDVSKNRPRYTAKYFKNPPCLDISMPSQCLNPQCGMRGTYQETEELVLEDWADELEVLSDPGYRSIQTQYFHSEVTNKRSDTSGCCCGYCDGESFI